MVISYGAIIKFNRVVQTQFVNFWTKNCSKADFFEIYFFIPYSKFVKIKKFIDETNLDYALSDLHPEMVEMLNRFTRIVILIPNAYEVFYVANFEKGCASSKSGIQINIFILPI